MSTPSQTREQSPPQLVTTPVAVGLALLVLLTVLVTVDVSLLVDLDVEISAAAARYGADHPGWVELMSAVTHLGDPQAALVVGVLLTGVLLVLRRWAAAVTVVAVVMVLGLFRQGMMLGVGRDRPEGWLVEVTGHAFPSGHTTTATAAALLLLHFTWPLVGGVGRVVVVAVAVLWAAAVGVSRVALVVHWPSDVVAGWALACAVVPMVIALVQRFRPAPGPTP